MTKLPDSIIKKDIQRINKFIKSQNFVAVFIIIILSVLLSIVLINSFITTQELNKYVQGQQDYIERVDAFCVKVHDVEDNLIVFKQYRTCMMDNMVGQGEWKQ